VEQCETYVKLFHTKKLSTSYPQNAFKISTLKFIR